MDHGIEGLNLIFPTKHVIRNPQSLKAGHCLSETFTEETFFRALF